MKFNWYLSMKLKPFETAATVLALPLCTALLLLVFVPFFPLSFHPLFLFFLVSSVVVF